MSEGLCVQDVACKRVYTFGLSTLDYCSTNHLEPYRHFIQETNCFLRKYYSDFLQTQNGGRKNKSC